MTEKKNNLTPAQQARSVQIGRTLGELTGDAQLKLVYSFLFTLATWGGLNAGWNIHMPFLPVWLLTMTGLMMLRHVSRTIAKSTEKGEFEATYQNFLQFVPNGTPAEGTAASALLHNHRQDGQGGPYL